MRVANISGQGQALRRPVILAGSSVSVWWWPHKVARAGVVAWVHEHDPDGIEMLGRELSG